jgi:hypothetical protein
MTPEVAALGRAWRRAVPSPWTARLQARRLSADYWPTR